MSYKDKVKKAMELSLRDQVLQKYNICVWWNGLEIFTDESTIIRLALPQNNTCYLVVDDNDNDNRVVQALPHIKTLQQFEDLYKALTGKELGCE